MAISRNFSMPDIRSFKIVGYRSIRDLKAKIERVTVLVGKNGVGKSNLYRGLQLIQAAAQNQLARAIASEGGLESVAWAGPKGATLPDGMVFTVEWDDVVYELDVGFERKQIPRQSLFPQDPFVRTEKIFLRTGERLTPLVERSGPLLKYRDGGGRWDRYPHTLATNEAMLSQLREPERFPELLSVKNRVDDWRFYHTFRADPDSPLRQKQVMFRVGRLDSDGGNLAAALLSIHEGPERDFLHNLVAMAFPGVSLAFTANAGETRQEIGLHVAGIERPMVAAEISDGQLRLLALLAALLSRQSPSLMVLNEPETSLHPASLNALAEAVHHAAQWSQILLVTHSKKLAQMIANKRPAKVRKLRWSMQRGTRIDDQIRINGE